MLNTITIVFFHRFSTIWNAISSYSPRSQIYNQFKSFFILFRFYFSRLEGYGWALVHSKSKSILHSNYGITVTRLRFHVQISTR